MRILFVKLSSIGDIVHTLPTLAAVKKRFPTASISWVVESSAAEILRGNPLIDNLIEIDTRKIRNPKALLQNLAETKSRFRNLRSEEYDHVIDFQGLLKSAVVARISKSKHVSGFDKDGLREPAAKRLYRSSHRVDLKTNVILKNLSLASQALDAQLATDVLEFPISTDPTHVREASDIAAGISERFAILNPAGGWPTKLWPASNYAALADDLLERHGIQSVVSVGPGEDDLAREVAAATSNAKVIRPSLKGFFELAKRAAVYVGGDTAPTHLAYAADCPVIGIFGPTEWWRNGTLNPEDICVERNDIDCRVDCHRRSCDKWICMDIEPKTVRLAIERRLGL